MIKIDKLDKFNIYASSSLSTDDYITLSLLYEPLIGSESYVMYQMLFAVVERVGLKSESFYYEGLLDLLGLTDEKFNDNRLKLEAIGLLETFTNSESFVLLLKHPLTPRQFLVDSEFSIYLNSRVGDKMFNYLISRFKIEKFDRKGYRNLTVNFNDVFETIDTSLKNEVKDVILGRKPNSPVKMKNYSFDYEYFLNSIDRQYISYESMEKFKNNIINKSYVFGFDEDEMISLYNESINRNGLFDLKLLNKKAYELYKYKSNNNTPYLGEKQNDEEDDVLTILANTSIKDLLDAYWPNYPSTYLKTINDIYETIDLDRSVLNILVYRILKEKNGELPTLQYFKKASLTWIERGITTPELALEYIKRANKDKKEVSKSTQIKENVKTNDWIEDYKKNFMKGFEE